ncbi:hypothetical protein ACH6EH_06945 [Paenibacillus sp. JSM ZJ436]|uniref:phage lytic cycle repressor MrpR family protein n=1 Tax=Paenibacillus sp. JSM ZJ436 TaxID=3376190 RepID=UPI00378B1F1B
MSNRIYHQKLYNPEQKERFLKNFSSNTYDAYHRLLVKASSSEKRNGKDLYDFNLYEIERLMHYLSPGSLSSAMSYVCTIQLYIRWAIEQDLRTNNLNPLLVVPDEFYSKFIDKSRKTIFTLSEIQTLEADLFNAQDAGILRCVFEGVSGKKYSEILNLTMKDVDIENCILTLHDDISENETLVRQIKVSQELITLLIKADKEDIYYKNNGNPSENIKAPTAKLVESKYVFKNTQLNTKGNERADHYLILRKLKKVAQWFGWDYLTGSNIRNSGMLYMASRLYKVNNKLSKNEIDQVCEHFNISRINDKPSSYNTTRLRKEFLNVDTILKYYGEIE